MSLWNPSFCLLDHPGTLQGHGHCECRKDPDIGVVVVVVQLLKDDGQNCGTCCYPLSSMGGGPWALEPFLHPTPL